jgi:predicted nucleotidyltransferase component of viral defense system
MKPLRIRLEEARKRTALPWEIIEKDYILSWILAGISKVDALRDTLIFKGGTALKKCYFGDYRFSEDLDFSAVGEAPTGIAMEKAIQEACITAVKLMEEYAPVEIISGRYTEREPHPSGQEAFIIRARLPWHRTPHASAMVEVSMDEPVIKPVGHLQIIHEYGEQLDERVTVYSLEEIIAEKLRAILQHIEKLQTRGWSRSRARDYYDLWRVFNSYGNDLDLSDFGSFLRKKCSVRGVAFQRADDFFQKGMLAYVETTWEQWLGPLVSDLPPFQSVMKELRPRIEAIVTS